MKQLFTLILLTLLPMLANAEKVKIGFFWYNLVTKAKVAEIIDYADIPDHADVSIPTSVEYEGVTYDVTSVGERAFYNCDNLTSIVIPNSVVSIGNGAFENCRFLISITIPNSVSSINERVFYYCSRLKSVTIPNSVTSIGDQAFEGCIGLKSIAIPQSVTYIGLSAFSGCSGFTSFTIPESVTSIGSGAFQNCRNLTSVTIGNGVSEIGVSTFYNCSSLISVTIGSGVKTIWFKAFANCTELADVYCYAEKIPQTSSDVFEGSYIEYATLHVPASSLEQYKATAPWSDFGSKVPIDGDEPNPEPKKCATPTISYVDGELVFNSETEDAVFVSEITDADIKKHYSKSVSLTATYNICVFATKEGFENSDTIQATLCWIDAEPISEGLTDEDAVAEVKALPVLINSQGGTITIQGAADGTQIDIFSIDGKKEGSAIAIGGGTTISTSLKPSSVAVVKIGEKAVKVVIR